MNSGEYKTQSLARVLFDEALEAQRSKSYRRAIGLYSASLALHPSARGYAYRGWARSFLGHYEEAIEDCRQALDVDPMYGNAYNDIGAYLIELGRSDEAVTWLEQAIRAPRHEVRCYPFMNLGRIFMRRGELRRALRYLYRGLKVEPRYAPALLAITAIERKLN